MQAGFSTHGPSRSSCPFADGCLRSKQTRDVWSAPRMAGRVAAERSLHRARTRSQAIRVAIAPPRTSATTATLASTTQIIRTGALSRLHAPSWQPHQLISRRAPMARAKTLHTRVSSAPRWMGLISRRLIRPTRHPQSHIRPGFGPEAWPNSINWLGSELAPVGALPVPARSRSGRQLHSLKWAPPTTDDFDTLTYRCDTVTFCRLQLVRAIWSHRK